MPARQIAALFPDTAEGEIDQERVAVLLAAVPGALDQGMANLGRPPLRSTREAIFQTRSTIEVLRANRVQLFGETGRASDVASAALVSYVEFLETDVLPRSDGAWAIGKEHYDYILRNRWLMDEDADDIIAMGKAALDRKSVE